MRPLGMSFALLIARRRMQQDGKCSAEQDSAVGTIVRSRKGMAALCETMEEYASASGERLGGWQDIIAWIIENWEVILQMIMSIIGLFGEDE